MPNVDEQLTERFRAAETQLEVEGLFEGIERRRARREVARRVQTSLLAFAVIAATVAGFVALRAAFDPARTPPGESASPTALPGNGLIAFAREMEEDQFRLYTARSDGSDVRPIGDGTWEGLDPAFSPDGEAIAFSYRFEEPGLVLATMPISGGPIVEHTSGGVFATESAWAPDGRLIAFVGSGIDSSSLYVIDVGGAEPEATIRDLFDDLHLQGISGDPIHPTWSPDGTRIAFQLTPGMGGSEVGLATIKPDGSDFAWVLPGIDGTPAWSPDGSRIAFVRPGEGGDQIWTVTPEGTDENLIATAEGASLESDLGWAPDGSALLVSDGEWIYRVDATPEGDPAGNFVQLVRGVSPAWQPIPVAAAPSVTPEQNPEPSESPSPEALGHDIGLGFRLCHLHPLGGIDFLGDGTNGKAWTGTRLLENGNCPESDRDRYGVAVDYTGDGTADTWSGETIEYCGGCEPWKAMDLNGDGRKELLVIVDYFSIMHYGVYTLLDANGRFEVEPFRIGAPGHPEHELHAGKPFTFWVGGDAGLSDWFYCETLPEFWLTGVVSVIEPTPDDVKTVHRTHVSLMTDGIAHILFADTYTVPGDTDLQLPHTSPFFMDPDCGIGVGPG